MPKASPTRHISSFSFLVLCSRCTDSFFFFFFFFFYLALTSDFNFLSVFITVT